MTEQQTKQAIDIYSKMLLSMGKLPRKPHDRKLVGFMAQQGKLYDGGLMVVGRALNDWDVIPDEDMASPEKARSRATAIAAVAQGQKGECPLEWVLHRTKAYNPKSSALWRVIRRVALDVCDGASENDWPSHLIWSNLYKVARQTTKPGEDGNPTKPQRDAQLDGCNELLRLEMKAFSPSHLLFLTGWEWAQPFLGDHCMKPAKGSTYAERTGRLPTGTGKSCAAVVACHPRGRKEDPWVCAILANFKSLLDG